MVKGPQSAAWEPFDDLKVKTNSDWVSEMAFVGDVRMDKKKKTFCDFLLQHYIRNQNRRWGEESKHEEHLHGGINAMPFYTHSLQTHPAIIFL